MSELLGLENASMWGTNRCNKFFNLLEKKLFWAMLEGFCNYFMHMAQTSDQAQLLHFSRELLHGIHSVFPLPQVSGHNKQYPIYKKNLDSGEGQWAVRKDLIGWMVDGTTRCTELLWDKKSVIDADLHNIVRMTKGVPLKKIAKLIGKI